MPPPEHMKMAMVQPFRASDLGDRLTLDMLSLRLADDLARDLEGDFGLRKDLSDATGAPVRDLAEGVADQGGKDWNHERALQDQRDELTSKILAVMERERQVTSWQTCIEDLSGHAEIRPLLEANAERAAVVSSFAKHASSISLEQTLGISQGQLLQVERLSLQLGAMQRTFRNVVAEALERKK